MSTQYKKADEVPTSVLADRLTELSLAVSDGPESVARNFTMRIPAELDRDADLVLGEAARRLRAAAPTPQAGEADGRPTVWMVRRHDAPEYWIPFMHTPVDAMKDPEREVVRLNWPAAPTQQEADLVCDGSRGALCIHQDPNNCHRERDCPAFAPTQQEADARDAARYRWLRDHPLWAVTYRIKKGVKEWRMMVECDPWGHWWPTHEQAVDHAMKGEPK